MDRRELILARMATLLSGMTGVVKFWRNYAGANVTQRPAVILLDGTEVATLPSGRDRMSNNVYSLQPQIFVLLADDSKDDNANVAANIAAWRIKIIQTLGSDATLHGLLTSNGGIDYNGLETDMQNGMLMRGEVQFNFSIRYPLVISELLS